MSVDNEIYDRHADTWWSEDGFLHLLKTAVNPARFGYFKRVLTQTLRRDPEGRSVLDVGCGGGILAEEFARLGCQVTGVDPSAPSLAAAQQHAAQEGLAITYRQSAGERLPFPADAFDVICCCDVLEHVADVSAVLAEIARVLTPGGVFFYDTINRTGKSKLVAIKLMQEWSWSRIMPPGLHDWDLFIKPEELAASLRQAGLDPRELVGMVPGIHPLGLIKAVWDWKTGKISFGELGRRVRFKESEDTSISFLGYALKGSSRPGHEHRSGGAGEDAERHPDHAGETGGQAPGGAGKDRGDGGGEPEAAIARNAQAEPAEEEPGHHARGEADGGRCETRAAVTDMGGADGRRQQAGSEARQEAEPGAARPGAAAPQAGEEDEAESGGARGRAAG